MDCGCTRAVVWLGLGGGVCKGLGSCLLLRSLVLVLMFKAIA